MINNLNHEAYNMLMSRDDGVLAVIGAIAAGILGGLLLAEILKGLKKECPNCHNQIEQNRDSCPHCGCRLR
jgi:hypothetical protein